MHGQQNIKKNSYFP